MKVAARSVEAEMIGGKKKGRPLEIAGDGRRGRATDMVVHAV